MTEELVDGSSSLDLPETDGTVPGGREGESRVLGEDDLRDEMRVSSEHLGGCTPFSVLVVILSWGELPLDEGFVTGTRKEPLSSDLSVLNSLTNSEGGNPATVA